jgi:hypothetical protein
VEFSTRYEDKGGEIGVYSPAQLDILLTRIERRFVPFVAIAGFAGLRSAEIAASRGTTFAGSTATSS